MGSMSRKIKRQTQIRHLKTLGIYCCGNLMDCIEDYDKGLDLWVCKKCGKNRLLPHLNEVRLYRRRPIE